MPPASILAAIALLLSFSCAMAAATGNNYSGGSVVITTHGRGTRVAAPATAADAAAHDSKWLRRLEGEVAPELGSLLAADHGYISYDTLNRDKQACGGSCAAQGASYTRPCIYSHQCRG